MGPRLGVCLLASAALAVSPLSEAFADRALTPASKRQAKSKAHAAPKRAAPAAAVNTLSLSGTYALSSVNGRSVRDVELAKSKVTFQPRGEVSVATSCYGFSAALESKSSPHQILGFTRVLAPAIGCPATQNRAHSAVMRLFIDTANIARAGNTITFFNATGLNIAQWTAIANTAPTQQEVSAPQLGAPAPTPVRAYFGDYILTELNGQPITSPPARQVRPPQQGAPEPQAAPAPASIITQPSLFLREDGRVMGSSGCNQYNSAMTRSPDGTVKFGPVVTTKKACLNPTMRAMENNFFSAMRRASRIDITASRIDLFAANGQRSARLSAIGARAEAGLSLYGKRWILRRINTLAVSTPNPPTIEFGATQATGNSGCNQFTIQHDRNNGRSRFSNAIMTRRACLDAQLNTLESRFMAALTATSITEISATTLTLSSADRRTALVFEVE
jgi:heat shock protein HslJ